MFTIKNILYKDCIILNVCCLIPTELFSKPHLAVNPVEIFEGEKFKLTCSATVYVPERLSNETVQLYIYKDNVKLTSSGTYISVANPYKNGNYTCKAYAVSQGHSILKQSQTLVVKAKGKS